MAQRSLCRAAVTSLSSWDSLSHLLHKYKKDKTQKYKSKKVSMRDNGSTIILSGGEDDQRCNSQDS